jgi:glycosyl transferase family 25
MLSGFVMINNISIFDIFERIFIVNLPERTDRRTEMVLELKKLAISETDPRVVFFPAIKPETTAGFPSIGARGCFLSHLAIFKQVQALNLTTVLIMEDDLSIHPQLLIQLNDISQALQQHEWGFTYLGHVEKIIETKIDSFDLIVYSLPMMTTHFYAIHARILDRLIEFLETVLSRPPGHPEGGPMHYDGALSTFRQQNTDVLTLIATPNMGWQRSSRSDIADNHYLDRISFMRPLVTGFRRFKNQLKTVLSWF